MSINSSIEDSDSDGSCEDTILELKFSNLQTLIGHTVFSEENFIRFNKNKNVIVNDNLKNMFQGTWSRFEAKTNGHINLSKYKQIKKDKLKDLIKKELSLKKFDNDSDRYNYNINPNLFFLVFDYNELCKLFEIKPLKNNGELVGLYISKKKKKYLRNEIWCSLLFHSKILLDDRISSILGKKMFCDIFVKGCRIEEKKYYSKAKYLDLVYYLEDYCLALEINEYHHDVSVDLLTKYEVENENSKTIILPIYVNKHSNGINDTYINFISYICKLLHKKNTYISKSVILYLCVLKSFKLEYTKFFVKVLNKDIKVKFTDIVEFTFLKNLDLKTVVNIIKEDGSFENEFKKNEKKINLDNLIKENIKLSTSNLRGILSIIPGKFWINKGDYREYEDKIFRNYIDLIKEFLNNEEDDSRYMSLKNFQNLNDLKKYCDVFDDIKNYFESIENSNDYHQDIPFLKKCEKSVINFEHINNVLRLKNKIDNYKMYINDPILIGYRVISYDEFNDLKN